MTRIAVISDVHGNRHALAAVLAEIDRERPDLVWCLGDTVGYGPSPNECCDAVQSRADVCLVGNHDLAVLGEVDISEFNHDAAAAAEWTRSALAGASRAFLESLRPEARTADAELYHASPRDPVWEYVLTTDVALAALEMTSAAIVLVGHSHIALAVSRGVAGVGGDVAPDGTRVELDAGRWLLNPGAVGQPRDGDPRAAWLLLDLARRFAAFRRVPYDIRATQAESRAAGLPESLAVRLELGQ
jgi:diadenosine tetraphosphatase ApaH/serine/threonine PP2A family protein phosphatase